MAAGPELVVSERADLLVIGGASLDVLHFSGQTVRSAGGAGLYTALAAHRAGAHVTMYGPRPAPMPEELAPAAERLDWIGPEVAPEELPRFEIVNHADGRTEVVGLVWGAEALLRPEQAPETGRAGDWVYCVPLADTALQLAFLRSFKDRGRRVACGTYCHLASDHFELTRQTLAEADAFFCNEEEANVLFRGFDHAAAAPGRLLFVTRGAQGARVFQGAHWTDVPGLPVRELDPTGAGDTFCGTTLARLAQGDHPVEAARRGVAHSSEMIRDVGPRALLRAPPIPEPPDDPRARADRVRVESVASLLATLPEVRPFDFVSELLPPVSHPLALDFFFTATLQQFGFWSLAGERYGQPMIASLGGRRLKGSDYLWAAYLRWVEDDGRGLAPSAQASLDSTVFAERLRSDACEQPLPAPELHLESARAYGRDMTALGWTPRALVDGANPAASPLRWLLSRLDHVAGYKEDPLRKKSALLAAILRERPERFLRSDADADLPPIVDYHVQRSCLRLGLVVVEDAMLEKRLRSRQVLVAEDEQAVRRAAFRAMQALTDSSGLSMAACDAFLFEMRHRCPEMTEPDCARCPVDAVCAHRRVLFQPVFRTTFY